MKINPNIRAVDLTAGDIYSIVEDVVAKMSAPPTISQSRTYVYGLQGIMDLFHCGKTKASKLKQGKIRRACRQDGRTIIVDAEEAMRLMKA